MTFARQLESQWPWGHRPGGQWPSRGAWGGQWPNRPLETQSAGQWPVGGERGGQWPTLPPPPPAVRLVGQWPSRGAWGGQWLTRPLEDQSAGQWPEMGERGSQWPTLPGTRQVGSLVALDKTRQASKQPKSHKKGDRGTKQRQRTHFRGQGGERTDAAQGGGLRPPPPLDTAVGAICHRGL